MEAQTAIPVEARANYVQLRMMREPVAFFMLIDEGASSSMELVGDVVDEHGKETKPSERLRRDKIKDAVRAIPLKRKDGSVDLIPVRPVK